MMCMQDALASLGLHSAVSLLTDPFEMKSCYGWRELKRNNP